MKTKKNLETMSTYTFFTDFNMTTEIDGCYYSEFMSESDAVTQTENGFEVELDYFRITSDTTAELEICCYGGRFEIDLDGLADENETIYDFFEEVLVD
jgi:hypothetical protein